MADTEIPALGKISVRQLKQLVGFASNDPKTTRNWLLEIGDTEQLEYQLTEMCTGIGLSVGAILQAVCSHQTPVDVLIEVKSAAKRLAVKVEAPSQKAAAILLYHLSVASALAYQGRNISSKAPAERLRLYEDLAAALCDDDLAIIFERASAALRL